MDKVKDVMRIEIRNWLGYPTSDVHEILIDDLYNKLKETCVDLSSQEDYPTICMYCGRPAYTECG